jgi:DNA polymerase III subunit epsilon
MAIFHKMEKRDLSAALQFYCGKEHTDALAALADVEATKEVLFAQIEKYQLQPTAEELHNFCSDDKVNNRLCPKIYQKQIRCNRLQFW